MWTNTERDHNNVFNSPTNGLFESPKHFYQTTYLLHIQIQYNDYWQSVISSQIYTLDEVVETYALGLNPTQYMVSLVETRNDSYLNSISLVLTGILPL